MIRDGGSQKEHTTAMEASPNEATKKGVSSKRGVLGSRSIRSVVSGPRSSSVPRAASQPLPHLPSDPCPFGQFGSVHSEETNPEQHAQRLLPDGDLSPFASFGLFSFKVVKVS